MPESSKRKKQAYTPPPEKKLRKSPVRVEGSRWLPIVMIALFVIGLLWIVVWYIAPTNPVMVNLAGWNVAVGFAFIGVGFVLSTRWK